MTTAPKLTDIRKALKAIESDNTVSCPQPGWFTVRLPYAHGVAIRTAMTDLGLVEVTDKLDIHGDILTFCTASAYAASNTVDR